MTNEEVLRRVGLKLELLKKIKERHLEFLGHIIRKDFMEDLSLSGRAPGGQRNNLGRPETPGTQTGDQPDAGTAVTPTTTS